jgi:hypothetical protein
LPTTSSLKIRGHDGTGITWIVSQFGSAVVCAVRHIKVDMPEANVAEGVHAGTV